MTSVKVAVRVRPSNDREDGNCTIIEMDGNKTKIINPKKGLTKIGTEQSLEIQDIVISGEEAQPDHCVIEYVEGVVTLHPIEDSSCSVNGVALTSPSKLTQGALIQLGKSSVFRFNYPEEAEKLKQIRKDSTDKGSGQRNLGAYRSCLYRERPRKLGSKEIPQFLLNKESKKPYSTVLPDSVVDHLQDTYRHSSSSDSDPELVAYKDSTDKGSGQRNWGAYRSCLYCQRPRALGSKEIPQFLLNKESKKPYSTVLPDSVVDHLQDTYRHSSSSDSDPELVAYKDTNTLNLALMRNLGKMKLAAKVSSSPQTSESKDTTKPSSSPTPEESNTTKALLSATPNQQKKFKSSKSKETSSEHSVGWVVDRKGAHRTGGTQERENMDQGQDDASADAVGTSQTNGADPCASNVSVSFASTCGARKTVSIGDGQKTGGGQRVSVTDAVKTPVATPAVSASSVSGKGDRPNNAVLKAVMDADSDFVANSGGNLGPLSKKKDSTDKGSGQRNLGAYRSCLYRERPRKLGSKEIPQFLLNKESKKPYSTVLPGSVVDHLQATYRHSSSSDSDPELVAYKDSTDKGSGQRNWGAYRSCLYCQRPRALGSKEIPQFLLNKESKKPYSTVLPGSVVDHLQATYRHSSSSDSDPELVAYKDTNTLNLALMRNLGKMKLAAKVSSSPQTSESKDTTKPSSSPTPEESNTTKALLSATPNQQKKFKSSKSKETSSEHSVGWVVDRKGAHRTGGTQERENMDQGQDDASADAVGTSQTNGADPCASNVSVSFASTCGARKTVSIGDGQKTGGGQRVSVTDAVKTPVATPAVSASSVSGKGDRPNNAVLKAVMDADSDFVANSGGNLGPLSKKKDSTDKGSGQRNLGAYRSCLYRERPRKLGSKEIPQFLLNKESKKPYSTVLPDSVVDHLQDTYRHSSSSDSDPELVAYKDSTDKGSGQRNWGAYRSCLYCQRPRALGSKEIPQFLLNKESKKPYSTVLPGSVVDHLQATYRHSSSSDSDPELVAYKDSTDKGSGQRNWGAYRSCLYCQRPRALGSKEIPQFLLNKESKKPYSTVLPGSVVDHLQATYRHSSSSDSDPELVAYKDTNTLNLALMRNLGKMKLAAKVSSSPQTSESKDTTKPSSSPTPEESNTTKALLSATPNQQKKFKSSKSKETSSEHSVGWVVDRKGAHRTGGTQERENMDQGQDDASADAVGTSQTNGADPCASNVSVSFASTCGARKTVSIGDGQKTGGGQRVSVTDAVKTPVATPAVSASSVSGKGDRPNNAVLKAVMDADSDFVANSGGNLGPLSKKKDSTDKGSGQRNLGAYRSCLYRERPRKLGSKEIPQFLLNKESKKPYSTVLPDSVVDHLQDTYRHSSSSDSDPELVAYKDSTDKGSGQINWGAYRSCLYRERPRALGSKEIPQFLLNKESKKPYSTVLPGSVVDHLQATYRHSSSSDSDPELVAYKDTNTLNLALMRNLGKMKLAAKVSSSPQTSESKDTTKPSSSPTPEESNTTKALLSATPNQQKKFKSSKSKETSSEHSVGWVVDRKGAHRTGGTQERENMDQGQDDASADAVGTSQTNGADPCASNVSVSFASTCGARKTVSIGDGQKTGGGQRVSVTDAVKTPVATPAVSASSVSGKGDRPNNAVLKAVMDADSDFVANSDGNLGPLSKKKKKRRKADTGTDLPDTDASIPDKTLNDFGGSEKLLAEIHKHFKEFFYADFFRFAWGSDKKICRRYLLHGPRGSGKRFLAECMAGHLKLPLLKPRINTLISGVSGNFEQRIRDLFDEAADQAPCVLYLEEIECLAPRQDTPGASKNMMMTRIASELGTCIDELQNRPEKIILIATTTRIESVNKDLRIPGRFIEKTLGMPDEKSRETLLLKFCDGYVLSPDLSLRTLAKLTSGFVAGDLRELVDDANSTAFERVSNLYQTSSAESDAVNYTPAPQPPAHLTGSDIEFTEQDRVAVALTEEDFREALKKAQPAAKREGFATVPTTTWEDIGGLENVRAQLQDSILCRIRDPERARAYGLSTNSGIILFGPPGCGKSLVAKAMANEAGLNFMYIKGPELLDKYVGESEKKLRETFDKAQTCAPCLIFFDEMDTLCSNRQHSEGSNVGKSVTNQLLALMDGCNERDQVYVMGATNHIEHVDPALQRPGRFGKNIFIGLPDESSRLDILKAFTRGGSKCKLVSCDLQHFAQETTGFSGADLKQLVEEASLIAMNDSEAGRCQEHVVMGDHFSRALLLVKPSVLKKDAEKYLRVAQRT